MEPIKLVKNHPSFQRVAKKIAEQVTGMRQATLRLAIHNLTRPGRYFAPDRLNQAITEECDRIEYSLVRRMLRQNGFAGKYVAH